MFDQIQAILSKELFPQSFEPLKSTMKYQQSSVALILKEDNGIQILFCQRSLNPKDLHSGEICFPGGKCDNEETDYQAVIRETYEEIGLDLTRCIYLGRLANNFSCEFKQKRHLKMCGHIFFLKQDQQFQINQSEICDYRWVDLNYFQDSNMSFICQKLGQQYAKYLIDQTLFKHPKIQNYLKDHVVDFQMTFIDIGMNQVLYGFTLYLLCQLFQILKENGLYQIAHKQIEKLIYNYQFFFDTPLLSFFYKKVFDYYFMMKRIRAKPKL